MSIDRLNVRNLLALGLATVTVACASVGCSSGAGLEEDAYEGETSGTGESEVGVRVPKSLNLNKTKIFYLTFDDGPSPKYTARILDTLKKHNAPATFFLTGTNIRGNEPLLKRESNEGHIVANHQQEHIQSTLEQFRRWVPAERDSIDAISGKTQVKYFRYPYGAGTADKEVVLKAEGYAHGGVGWDIDTLDWCFGGGRGRCDRASGGFKNDYVGWVLSESRRMGGGVILFHDIQGVTADNLDRIMTALERDGYSWGALPGASSPAPPPAPPPVVSCVEPPVGRLETLGSKFTLTHGPAATPEKFRAAMSVIPGGAPASLGRPDFDKKFAVVHDASDQSTLAFKLVAPDGKGIEGARYNMKFAPNANHPFKAEWVCDHYEGAFTLPTGTSEPLRIKL